MLSFLTNKHLVIALLVAPILTVIAWFVTDKMVTPEAEVASVGKSYELIAKPNCRYESSKCELVNGDVKLTIHSVKETSSQNPSLTYTSTVPVEILRIEFLNADQETQHIVRHSDESGLFEAKEEVSASYDDITTMRLAFVSAGVHYYAETQTAFMNAL